MKSRIRSRAGKRLKEPFGKAGLTVAVLALVMAMVGGAYAAGALTGKQKKEVEKIAKKFAGKPGTAGANGTNGTNGAPGEKGAPGVPGTLGAPGESVTVTSLSAPACNGQGGARFEVGSEEAEVCNGTTGFTETLPGGKTETGEWAFVTTLEGPEGFPQANVALSFTIPLEEGAVPNLVFLEPGQTEPLKCPGTAAEPKAAPGDLCVYSEALGNGVSEVKLGAGLPSVSGALLIFIDQSGGEPKPEQGYGSWAVTAPE